MEKEKKRRGGLAIKLLMLVCICVMIGCAVYLGDIYLESRQIQQNSEETAQLYTVTLPEPAPEETDEVEEETEPLYYPELAIDFNSLYAASPNVVAWLQVSGIGVISYPVVWYPDDIYYLDHAWDGRESRYGAIFVETANSGDCTDLYTIIYGHNMKDGSMFGSLKKYADESFYQENGGIITLYLPEETRFYQIFSVEYVDPSNTGVYTVGFAQDETYENFLQSMKKRSRYDTGVEVSREDTVLTLSTCANGGTSRFVVHAKLVQTTPVE